MVVLELRGHFEKPEIAALGDRDRCVVEGLVRLHAPIRGEEPRSVALNRTAQRQVGLVVLATIGGNAFDVRAVEILRDREERHRSVKVVAAALGHDVHELSDHARAVGGFGAERLDLDVLNGVVVQVDGEDVAAERVGDVGAIEARASFGSGQFLRGGIDVDARHHEPRVLEPPVRRHRHRGQRLIVDIDRQAGALRIDDRRLAGDGHGLGDRSDPQRDVDLSHRVETNRLFADDRLESGQLGADVVDRRRQVGDAEHPLRVGDGGELAQRFRAGDGQRDAGQHGAAGVRDSSGDGAGRRPLRGGERRNTRERETQQAGRAKVTLHRILLAIRTESCARPG